MLPSFNHGNSNQRVPQPIMTQSMSSTAPPTTPPLTEPLVSLLDGTVHAVTEAQAIEWVMASLRAGRGGWVVTHNLDHLRLLRRDRSFRAACEQSTLRVADGMPLIWASWLAGTPLPQRVAGSSLISTLSAAAAREARSIFLLGGDPGAAEGAAAVLQARHPGLHCAGTLCPPFGFERDAPTMAEIRRVLSEARPDIVFVALSAPRQEQIIAMLRDAAPQAWWMGVGISFSFLCGQVRRAPRWVQRVGLEWLHRLCQEPRKLARRYLLQGFPFAVELFMGSLRQRWRGRHGGRPPMPL